MLSFDDSTIVRNDPEVFGLRTLLDDDALTEFATESLSVPDLVEAHCEYVRYKPRQNCLAKFRIRDSRGITTDYYAIAYRALDCAKISKARQAIITPNLGM